MDVQQFLRTQPSKHKAKKNIERYSFGREYRKYCKLPSGFPLLINSLHGITFIDPVSEDLQKAKYAGMLCFDKTYKEKWESISNSPCYVVKHPHIMYKERAEIMRKESATGTIFFYAHSSSQLKFKSDQEEIIKALDSLPEKFKPVDICFHFIDVLDGNYKYFEDNGFSCLTAGHSLDERFVNNLYDILSSYSYAASNTIGSYVYNAVELGIPFSLVGPEPFEILNKGNKSYNFSKIIFKESLTEDYLKARDLFDGIFDTITNDQKRHVDINLGLNHSLKPSEFKKILTKNFIRYSIPYYKDEMKKKGKKFLHKVSKRLATKFYD